MPKRTDISHYAFLEHLKALPFVEAIYLFGSRARGDNTGRADIDLAVLCPSASQEEWWKIQEIVEKADTLLEIDCVNLSRLKNKDMLRNIEQDKVVVYEQNR